MKNLDLVYFESTPKDHVGYYGTSLESALSLLEHNKFPVNESRESKLFYYNFSDFIDEAEARDIASAEAGVKAIQSYILWSFPGLGEHLDSEGLLDLYMFSGGESLENLEEDNSSVLSYLVKKRNIEQNLLSQREVPMEYDMRGVLLALNKDIDNLPQHRLVEDNDLYCRSIDNGIEVFDSSYVSGVLPMGRFENYYLDHLKQLYRR